MTVYGNFTSPYGRTLTIQADAQSLYLQVGHQTDGTLAFNIPLNQSTCQQILNAIRSAMQVHYPGIS